MAGCVWDDIYEFMCKKGTQETAVSFRGSSLTSVESDPGVARVVWSLSYSQALKHYALLINSFLLLLESLHGVGKENPFEYQIFLYTEDKEFCFDTSTRPIFWFCFAISKYWRLRFRTVLFFPCFDPCEILFLILRTEYWLKLTMSMVLRNIIDPKKEGVTGH
jgi:hypothetical protein